MKNAICEKGQMGQTAKGAGRAGLERPLTPSNPTGERKKLREKTPESRTPPQKEQPSIHTAEELSLSEMAD